MRVVSLTGLPMDRVGFLLLFVIRLLMIDSLCLMLLIDVLRFKLRIGVMRLLLIDTLCLMLGIDMLCLMLLIGVLRLMRYTLVLCLMLCAMLIVIRILRMVGLSPLRILALVRILLWPLRLLLSHVRMRLPMFLMSWMSICRMPWHILALIKFRHRRPLAFLLSGSEELDSTDEDEDDTDNLEEEEAEVSAEMVDIPGDSRHCKTDDKISGSSETRHASPLYFF